MIVKLLRRLHDYLHRLDAEEHPSGAIVTAPLTWPPPFAEQGTAVQPPINFITVPVDVPDWQYPTQT